MKNIGKIDVLLMVFILDIVVFINCYSIGQKLYELLFFIPIYIIIISFLNSAWGCVLKSESEITLRRSLLSVLYTYFTLVLIIKVIAVVDMDLHNLIYRKKYINYTMALGLGFGLFMYPLYKKLKK